MGAMLIVKALLLLGIVSLSKLTSAQTSSSSAITTSSSPATSENPKPELTSQAAALTWSPEQINLNPYAAQRYIVPYGSGSSTSGSYEDATQAGTIVTTISGPKPSQTATYSPYQYYEENVQPSHRQDHRNAPSGYAESSKNVGNSSPQFQASPEIGYSKNSPSHSTQKNQRYHNNNKATSGTNPNSQLFTSPGSYRYVPENGKSVSPIRTNSFSPSVGPLPFPKFKSFPAVLASNQYPATFRDHSFEAFPKFRLTSGSNFNGQAPLVNSAQLSKGPYRAATYPVAKNLEITAPGSFSSGTSGSPNFRNFDKLVNNNYQYGNGASGVGLSGKKVALPVSLQLQNSPEVHSSFVQPFDNEQVLLSSGLNYQTHPSSGLNFDFSKASPTSLPDGSSPFVSAIGNYQPRILPVHTSSSTPHFHQYKGASVNAFNPGNDYAKPAAAYQFLANQPQLHFTTTGIPAKANGDRQSVVYHSKPFEQIRTDVEVIDKKKPKPPQHDDSGGDDESESEEGFKPIGEFGFNFPARNQNSGNSRPSKSPERETSYDLPTSNLFNSYDEAFGKYSKLASREENNNNNNNNNAKPRTVVHQNSKPVYQSVENDEDDEGSREKSSEDYRSSYSDDESGRNSSYEDEDEQESRRSERHESDPSSEERGAAEQNDDDDDDDDASAAYKSYGVDYEKEFEESYRKELPKNEYVHVKEVPEIEESTSESKKRPTTSSRNRPKTSRGGSKQKSRRVIQDEHEEPKEYESYTSHRYEERPKNSYRDNEGHGSRNSYKTSSSSDPPATESYGSKISRGTSRYTKKQNSEITPSSVIKDDNNDKNSKKTLISNRELPNRWSKFVGSSKQSSSTQKPITVALPAFESAESYTFPPFSHRKSSLKSSGIGDSFGAPSYAIESFSNPDFHGEGFRYFSTGQLTRDFSGI